MRFVEKRDEDITAKLNHINTYNALKSIVISKAKDKISDSIYRDAYSTSDGNRSKVEDQLALSYHNKCGYCERLVKSDIEHYRPKKKVVEDEAHEGYYWLCYEWSNLLPSCITCNREGAKHNQFPIIGTRVYNPPSLLDNDELDLDNFKAYSIELMGEIPYLLHPEIDNPERFFKFEISEDKKGIKMVGIDELGRGVKTIEICKLNRQEVQLARVSDVISDLRDSIRSVFSKIALDSKNLDTHLACLDTILAELFNRANDVQKTHTLLRRYIVKDPDNFKNIVLPFLSSSENKIVLAMFITVFERLHIVS